MRDLRDAFRAFRAAPIVTCVAVLSLALGIGANLAIFSILNSLLLKPLPVHDPHTLIVLASADQDEDLAISYRVWRELRQRRLIGRAFAWAAEPWDRGYNAAAIRRGLRTRHIVPLLAMRRTEHGSGLGRWRWVVERTFAWLSQFRRLRVRNDKRADIHDAFLSLGCALICWQSPRRTSRTV